VVKIIAGHNWEMSSIGCYPPQLNERSFS